MRAILVAFVLFLSACDRPVLEHRETLYVFGTLVEIVIRGEEPDIAQNAVADVSTLFQTLHRDWHAWRDGELVDLNRAIAAGEAFEASALTVRVLQQGVAFERQSGGLFNPAIGRLVGLWGFHADTPPEGDALPDRTSIAVLIQAAPSMAALSIEGRTIRANNPAVQLDLGGYAKGEAVALAMAILADHGIENAVINAGGGLMVRGDHGDRPWRVGLRHPAHWGVIGSVSLGDGEALMTSGNYERFREADGVHYSHIIDPRTGLPVPDVASVSVIHADPGLADAASTALTVAGPHHWQEVAERMGVELVLMIEADGTIQGTEAMLARVVLDPSKTN